MPPCASRSMPLISGESCCSRKSLLARASTFCALRRVAERGDQPGLEQQAASDPAWLADVERELQGTRVNGSRLHGVPSKERLPHPRRPIASPP